MSKVKKQGNPPKISSSPTIEKCPQGVSFSFGHLTTNKNFNFEFFSNNTHDLLAAKAAILDRLQELSQKSWLYWQGLSKRQGIEMLLSDDIRFSPSGYSLSGDEKVIVFRFSFSGTDCRIIGVKKSPCSVFYIIGFDFDHSAYNHGS